MQTKTPHENSTKTKRPIVITIFCILTLLYYLFGVFILLTKISTYGASAVLRQIGVGSASSLLLAVVSTILGITSTIGIWKMKKWAGKLYQVFTIVSVLFLFWQGQVFEQAYIVAVIILIIGFAILYHVVINNPNDEAAVGRKKNYGIALAVIGLAVFLYSSTAKFEVTNRYRVDPGTMGVPDAYNPLGEMYDSQTYIDTARKNLVKYTGITFLVCGVLFFIFGLTDKNKIANGMQTATINTGNTGTMAQIERLNDLRQKGVLTEEEFTAKKTELLAKL